MAGKEGSVKNKFERVFAKPFIYKKTSITNINVRMLVLVSVQIALLFFTKSYNALSVVFAAFLGAAFAFLLRFFFVKEPLYSGIGVVLQGLMMGMLLPENYPPVVAMLISFALLVIAGFAFSNLYNIWVNMVVLGVVVAWFVGKKFFPDFLLPPDFLGLQNPSLLLIQNGAFPVSSLDAKITSFLNGGLLRFLKITIPNGYVSFLWDTHSVIPAFRFNLVTIVSSFFLFYDDAVETLIPTVFVFVYAGLVRLFAPVFYGGAFNSGDVILAVFTSGTLFCALFLLQWSGTVPGTKFGKAVYAFLMGFLAFFIVGEGTSSVGMVYTILIGNVVTVLIKTLEDCKNLAILKKTLSTVEGAH